MLTQRRKRILALCLCHLLLVGILIFIFSHSVATVEESAAESRGVLDILKPFLQIFLGAENVTDHLIRKMAHFAEFAALGVTLSLLSLLYGWKPKNGLPTSLLAGILVAMTDETIQIFSHRGSQVQDVWLDSVGATCGILLTLVLYRILRHRKAG